jgi:hypothetical protein
MPALTPRRIVGVFGAMRVAIGVAFAVAPHKLGVRSDEGQAGVLMTRSFAVREIVLGVGGLLAASSAEISPSAIRRWAGLGALTDGGDLLTSLDAVRRGDRSARVPTVMAAAGLAAELAAFRGTICDSGGGRRRGRGGRDVGGGVPSTVPIPAPH